MHLQSEGGAKPRVEAAKATRDSGAGVFKFCLLLIRRFPAENRHRDGVRTTQIPLHLLLKIGKGIEAQMVIEAFLIVSVASLDLAVVPRSSRTYEFVLNLVVITEHVKWMHSLGFSEMGKFHTVICLNNLWSVSKKDNGTFYKVDSGIAAVFLVGIDKTLSRCFLDHGVLVEFPTVLPNITDFWDEFDVHLPLDTDHGRRVVGLVM